MVVCGISSSACSHVRNKEDAVGVRICRACNYVARLIHLHTTVGYLLNKHTGRTCGQAHIHTHTHLGLHWDLHALDDFRVEAWHNATSSESTPYDANGTPCVVVPENIALPMSCMSRAALDAATTLCRLYAAESASTFAGLYR